MTPSRSLVSNRTRVWPQATVIVGAALGWGHGALAQTYAGMQDTLLENGLEIFVVENHVAPLATVLVAVRNGAFTQEPGEEGLAHLYEHALFRSYDDDPMEFAIQASRLNAFYNGTTTDELVTYFLVLPSEETKGAIELLADLVSRARFTEANLTEELPIVLDELERDAADPEHVLERQMRRYLWGEAWHRKDVAGDSASLSQITPERLQRNYDRYYRPNNAALIVTGDVDTREVFTEAAKRFRDWKPGPVRNRHDVDPIPPMAGSPAILMGWDVGDVKVVFNLRGPSVGTDRRAVSTAEVFFQLFNDPSSGFQNRLVTHGPFVWVRGDYVSRHDVGPISISGATTPEQAEEAVSALVNELDVIADVIDITDVDLRAARKRRAVESALAAEVAATLAPDIAALWGSGWIQHARADSEDTDQPTVDDLRRFALEYLVQQPKVVGVLGPPSVIDRVAEWLGVAGRNGS